MITEASLPILADAIKTRHLVEFTYIDAVGEMTSRTVEPYQLKPTGHFFGWDVAKDGIRNFRVDRMQEPITVLEAIFTPRFEGIIDGVVVAEL